MPKKEREPTSKPKGARADPSPTPDSFRGPEMSISFVKKEKKRKEEYINRPE